MNKTRTRTTHTDTSSDDTSFLDDINTSLSDFNYSFKDDEKKESWVNFPTIAGIFLLIFTLLYGIQVLGLAHIGLNFALLMKLLIAGTIATIAIQVLPSGKKKKKKAATFDYSMFDIDDDESVTYERDREQSVKIRREKATERASFRLHRSRRNSKLSGICGGIAESLDIDPTLIRILFVALVLLTDGAALFFYFILTFIIPKD